MRYSKVVLNVAVWFTGSRICWKRGLLPLPFSFLPILHTYRNEKRGLSENKRWRKLTKKSRKAHTRVIFNSILIVCISSLKDYIKLYSSSTVGCTENISDLSNTAAHSSSSVVKSTVSTVIVKMKGTPTAQQDCRRMPPS